MSTTEAKQQGVLFHAEHLTETRVIIRYKSKNSVIATESSISSIVSYHARVT
jgi:hypothetical protein